MNKLNEPYRLKFTIDALPEISSNGSHGHWSGSAAKRKKWRHMTAFTIDMRRRPAQPLQRAKVIFTRHSSNEPDVDNLIISFKSCADGLRDANVIVDDKSSNLKAEYRWEKASPGKGFITVEVEEWLTD